MDSPKLLEALGGHTIEGASAWCHGVGSADLFESGEVAADEVSLTLDDGRVIAITEDPLESGVLVRIEGPSDD